MEVTILNETFFSFSIRGIFLTKMIDPLTKWLVRVASIIIIIAALLISLIIPILAINISSQLSILQDSIKETLELLIQQFLA